MQDRERWERGLLLTWYRAIFVWPWNEKARTKQKQQTNGNRAIWLVYGRYKRLWLSVALANSRVKKPKNFLEINRYFASPSYCNTVGQSNSAFSILGFLWRENDLFIHWLIKQITNTYRNRFSRVIRKSLYRAPADKLTKAENNIIIFKLPSGWCFLWTWLLHYLFLFMNNTCGVCKFKKSWLCTWESSKLSRVLLAGRWANIFSSTNSLNK